MRQGARSVGPGFLSKTWGEAAITNTKRVDIEKVRHLVRRRVAKGRVFAMPSGIAKAHTQPTQAVVPEEQPNEVRALAQRAQRGGRNQAFKLPTPRAVNNTDPPPLPNPHHKQHQTLKKVEKYGNVHREGGVGSPPGVGGGQGRCGQACSRSGWSAQRLHTTSICVVGDGVRHGGGGHV